MRCNFHPEVETTLCCSRCGKPICPQCLIQTPVGARCPDCADERRLPTFQLRSRHYLKAAGTALGLAVLCGIAWGVIRGLMPFIYLNLLLALGAGYLIGELTSLSVNRKRGRALMVIGGSGVFLSYVISVLFRGFSFHPFALAVNLAALALGIFVAISRLR